MKFVARTIDDLPEIAQKMLPILGERKKVAFYGEMGAGKTTFIKNLIRKMGVNDHVSSPTFSIVNSYVSESYGEIYHFDFYRLEDETEAYDIGADELLDGDGYCLMEWAEKIDNLLPENYVRVTITVENDCRIIKIGL